MNEHDPLPNAVYLWLDLEFTSDQPGSAKILEFAGRVTDSRFSPLGRPFSVVVRPDSFDSDSLSEDVGRMHEKSGLLNDIRSSGISTHKAQIDALSWLEETVPQDCDIVHCGYYVELDRLVMSREWPEFREDIGFRTLDVRSLEEAADAWSKAGRFTRKRSGGHRAAGDVDEAIELSARYALFFS